MHMGLRGKTFKLLAASSLALVSIAGAIPPLNKSWNEKQPDGTTLEVTNFGNEHFHYTGTTDGYPLHRDSLGFFRFIDENGKHVSKRPSHKDKAIRFLKKKFERDQSTPILRAPSENETVESTESAAGPLKQSAAKASPYSGEKNVLVILVQFKDTKFFSEDPQAVFDDMLNTEGYNADGNIGSARDYLLENSMGNFSPHFDVVGPITVSGNNYKDYGTYSKYKDYGAQVALVEAMDSLASKGFDFRKYDNDGDHYLDFIHMIYAGVGSHDSNQDSAIWPHKWIFQSRISIGKRPNRLYASNYACSAERDGHTYIRNRNTKKLSGIGNFLHEFSHLMGLPDLYTKNEENPGHTPYKWSIMDQGAYNTNNIDGPLATSPPYYSAFERMSLGWMNATELESGNVLLPSIDNNVALRLDNPENANEFFLLEYRSSKGWDSALPNHGMLIWHIDYNREAWANAKINYTEHQHVDIEEADGIADKQTLTGDVFPGRSGIKTFNKFILWDNTDLSVSLKNITEARDYTYVTFDVNAPAASEPASDESSSSETEDSSSSFESEESSSSVDIEISLNESFESSSSTVVSSDDPSEFVTAIAYSTHSKARIHTSHGMLHLSELPQGCSVSLFTINGNILYRQKETGSSLEIDISRFSGPLLLQISQKSGVIFAGRIR